MATASPPCARCGSPVKEARNTYCSRTCQARRNWTDDPRASFAFPYTQRVWDRLDRGIQKGAPGECWPWRGAHSLDGYGMIAVQSQGVRRNYSAHRLSLERHQGEAIPTGFMALHSCDNPPCCNPAHLRVGTQVDNVRDCVIRRRKPEHHMTHCKRGHPFDDKNTYRRKGRRVCRACSALKTQRWRTKQRFEPGHVPAEAL